jgi:hypothetical protein
MVGLRSAMRPLPLVVFFGCKKVAPAYVIRIDDFIIVILNAACMWLKRLTLARLGSAGSRVSGPTPPCTFLGRQ